MALHDGESPVERALRLPEIVSAIVPYLAGDRATLNAACRVNRLWAAIALPLLWRRVPHTALKCAAARRRSDVFDAAIRELDVVVSRQRFRRLRHFYRRHCHAAVATQSWTLQHVQMLSCTYGASRLADAAPRIAAWIACLAPCLTVVTIAFDAAAAAAKTYGRARGAAALCSSAGWTPQRVQRGNFRGDDDDGTGSRGSLCILAQLAHCRNLRQLSLAPTVTEAAAEHVLNAGIDALFQRLHTVDMHVFALTFTSLSQLWTSVTRLRLTMEGGGYYTQRIFESLAGLSQLRSLALKGRFVSPIDALLQLRRLAALAARSMLRASYSTTASTLCPATSISGCWRRAWHACAC
jgi:hypothetical protein